MKNTKGDVVFIEKGSKLTYDISHQIRLVDAEAYQISGFDAFFGFVSGICAANYDVTDIFIDGTLKIGGSDLEPSASLPTSSKPCRMPARRPLPCRFRPPARTFRRWMLRLSIRNRRVSRKHGISGISIA